MLERINTREELYNRKLGSALNMENKVLGLLDTNIDNAHDDQMKQLFRHHQDETRQQISNLEQSFRAFGWEPDEAMCLPMEALDKEAKLETKITDEKLVDHVVLMGAAETEHYEIAVYEGLIAEAQAMGRDDVAQLLSQNLEQEQHTLDEVKRATQRVVSMV